MPDEPTPDSAPESEEFRLDPPAAPVAPDGPPHLSGAPTDLMRRDTPFQTPGDTDTDEFATDPPELSEEGVLSDEAEAVDELENQATSISLASPAAASPPSDDAAEHSAGPLLDQTNTPVSVPATPQRAPSRLIFIMLISYASAATLALLFLLFFGPGSRRHQLESLPDVEPEPAGQLTFVPVGADLPPGHVLRLGESRRFGNMIVQPLAVTEGPLRFTHYSGDVSRERAPGGPVFKLWLRFTNASADQSIAPLDRNLLLRWVVKKETMQEYTNQYLFSPGAERLDEAVSVFHLPPTSEWDLADEQLGRVLAPGESFETYIASSDEGLDRLQDEVRWRVQFRKGFSRRGNGVTTLFDVAFGRNQMTRSCQHCQPKAG